MSASDWTSDGWRLSVGLLEPTGEWAWEVRPPIDMPGSAGDWHRAGFEWREGDARFAAESALLTMLEARERAGPPMGASTDKQYDSGRVEAWKQDAHRAGDHYGAVLAVVASHYARCMSHLPPAEWPPFGEYARNYCRDGHSLATNQPTGWALFRAEFPYDPSGPLMDGYSYRCATPDGRWPRKRRK
jgi:hypothetical protein